LELRNRTGADEAVPHRVLGLSAADCSSFARK
jgi:hypothetical protein